MDGAAYDSRTITKQTLSKINSKFGTFTRKTCESIEKFNFNNPEDGDGNNTTACFNGSDTEADAATQPTSRSTTHRYSNGSTEIASHDNAEVHVQRHLNGSSSATR